ncbi:MAG: hypothetical protein EOO52_13100 [Gammaproteobacteria bacterium]|nr:MAG: hypothetical protein EOO52_13100 [Gammaproteobacteria bacterium]
MIENVGTILFIAVMAVLLLRPLDTFYKAELIKEAADDNEAKKLVSDFQNSERPTCFKATFLLKKIKALKNRNLVKKYDARSTDEDSQ